MQIVLMILAGFLAVVVVTWMIVGELTVTGYLVIGCAFVLGSLFNELLRGKES